MSNLKEYVVVKTPDDKFEIWTQKDYIQYTIGAVMVGGATDCRIVTHFNEDENLLKDSPYQGSAGVWRSTINYPSTPGRIVVKTKERKLATYEYTGSDISKLCLRNDYSFWLDDSAASPAGDGWVSVEDFIRVRKALEDVVKDYDNCKLNAMRRDRKMYNDNVMIEVARDVLKRVPTPPNKSV